LFVFVSILSFLSSASGILRVLPSFPTRRSSDLRQAPDPRSSGAVPGGLRLHRAGRLRPELRRLPRPGVLRVPGAWLPGAGADRRSEEHTSELQSRENLVCRLLLEKKKTKR